MLIHLSVVLLSEVLSGFLVRSLLVMNVQKSQKQQTFKQKDWRVDQSHPETQSSWPATLRPDTPETKHTREEGLMVKHGSRDVKVQLFPVWLAVSSVFCGGFCAFLFSRVAEFFSVEVLRSRPAASRRDAGFYFLWLWVSLSRSHTDDL